MLIIGICGASGSGKSTLAGELTRELGEGCYVLNYDCYYADHPNLSFEERCALNYDEPCIFDHEDVLRDVKDLLAGKPVTKKQYDFSLHRRCDSGETITPPEVLIIEGIHCFWDDRLRDLMNLKLYVNVDPDICLLRRIRRDMNERGRSLESISNQYLNTVKPMFEQYISKYAAMADLIIPWGGKNACAVPVLCEYVRHELNARNR